MRRSRPRCGRRREARLPPAARALQRELVPLFGFLADRERPDPGASTPRISSAKTTPMCANWTRSSGRASAFAPTSISTDGPRFAGTVTAIAGDGHQGSAAARAGTRPASRRCCPRRRPRPPCPRPPSCRRRQRLCSFPRTASVGFSSIAITSGATISSSPCVSRCRPHDDRLHGSDAAARAPATISSGPRSPPMASTAIRVIGLGSRGAKRLDVAAAIGVARRADPVGRFGWPHCGQTFSAAIRSCAARGACLCGPWRFFSWGRPWDGAV